MPNIRAICVLLCLSTRIAAADDAELKDRDTALALSAGGTAVSAGLVVAAVVGGADSAPDHARFRTTLGELGVASLLVTPSLGEWYAGRYLTLGLALRAAGAATTLAGIAYSYCNDSTCSSDRGHALIAIGLAAAAAGIVYDIADARSTTDRYNRARAPRLAIMPTVLPSPSGPAMGIGLARTF
jgi:hypothetical protein